MKILGYKGVGLISKAIQWQTRSPYSHVAVLLDDESVIEAWHKGGVSRNKRMSSVHSKGTVIDIFNIAFDFDKQFAFDMLTGEIGKGYDFLAVARFLSRREVPLNSRWFCSELVHACFPFLLERIPSSYVSPRDVCISPFLKLERTVRI